MNNEAKRQNRLAIWLAAVTFLSMSGIVIFLVTQESAPSRNADTYCINNEEGGIKKIHAILLDVSEDFTETHERILQQRINLLWRNVGEEERIDLYVTQHDDKVAARPIISFCNPSKSGNIWTEGEMIQERRHREMWAKMKKEFETVSKKLGQDESPIIEALLSIGIVSLTEARHLGIPASLTIVSDMLQNSQTLNHYEEQPSFEEFKKRPVYDRVKPDLNGAVTSIWYLQRPGRESIQGARHAKFWISLIGDAGSAFGDPAVDKMRSGAQ